MRAAERREALGLDPSPRRRETPFAVKASLTPLALDWGDEASVPDEPPEAVRRFLDGLPSWFRFAQSGPLSGEERVRLDDETGCVLWLGKVSRDGYGLVRHQQRWHSKHRLTYEWAVGPIPEGYEIDHVRARGCTNRNCCAPWHLEAVTRGENARRRRKDRCLRGHDMSDALRAPGRAGPHVP